MKTLITALLLFVIFYLIANSQILLLLFIISLTLVVAAHEAGHAYFMRKHGVEIKEFGIGIGPVGKQLFYFNARKISLPFFKVNLPPIAFHPLLIGAYVVPTDAGEQYLQQLPLKARMQIFGGGVYANILLAILIYFAIYAWISIFALANGVMVPDHLMIQTVIAFVSAVLAVRFRYFLSSWSPSFFGILMAGLLWLTFTTPGGQATMSGPIGIVAMGAQAVSLLDVVILIFAITLSLGMFNSLPIPPLDGGHMAVAIMKRFHLPDVLITSFQRLGMLIFVIFVIFVFGNDIQNILLK